MADVLLIDDEKSVRSTLSLFLQKSGYKVDEAANGEDAIEKLKVTFYDLVITDLKMKPMGGLQVLQKVKEINPMTEVVVMTAYGTVESGVEAMKLGAYDYIQKPFDKDEFLIIVGKALERKELLVEVEQLQDEAFKSKNKADKLRETISDLEQDKSTAEEMLKLPEESFSRVLSKASSKGRARGIIEGIIIGFITGILSSLLVWYLTK